YKIAIQFLNDFCFYPLYSFTVKGLRYVDIFILKTFCREKDMLIFALPIRKVRGNKRAKISNHFRFNNHDSVAQLVEHPDFIGRVIGSGSIK
ncbi:MAG: hypothetical protein ACHQII_06480, partial [Bacteroidia bacterium]